LAGLVLEGVTIFVAEAVEVTTAEELIFLVPPFFIWGS